MKKTTKTWIVLIVLVLGLGLYLFWHSMRDNFGNKATLQVPTTQTQIKKKASSPLKEVQKSTNPAEIGGYTPL